MRRIGNSKGGFRRRGCAREERERVRAVDGSGAVEESGGSPAGEGVLRGVLDEGVRCSSVLT